MSEARDRLDEAIAVFVRDGLGRSGPVTGWTLCVSHMRYTDDDPVFGWDYACGPQTDLVRALGLLDVVRIDIEGTVARAATPDDDE